MDVVAGRNRRERPAEQVVREPAGEPANPQFFLARTPGSELIVRGARSHKLVSARFLPSGDARVERAVALTFDDGPSPIYTPRVLATLERLHVHATAWGTTNSAALGVMPDLLIGHVDGKPDAHNCIPQSERWSFASSHNAQDTFLATTKGDKLCFNKNFSAGVETAAFTITGGTGKFKGASGSGHLKLNVLSSPQKGSGTITGTLRLP